MVEVIVSQYIGIWSYKLIRNVGIPFIQEAEYPAVLDKYAALYNMCIDIQGANTIQGGYQPFICDKGNLKISSQ